MSNSPMASQEALDHWCNNNPNDLLDVVITMKSNAASTDCLSCHFSLEDKETVKVIGESSGILSARLTGKHIHQLLQADDIESIDQDSVQIAF